MTRIATPPNIVFALLVAGFAWSIGHRAPVETAFKDLNDASTLPPSGNGGYMVLGPGGSISAGSGSIRLCGPDAMIRVDEPVKEVVITGASFMGGSQ